MSAQQYQQLLDTLNGEQNFCIIERRKALELYELLEEMHDWHQFFHNTRPGRTLEIDWRVGDEGVEWIIGMRGYASAYRDLLARRDEYSRFNFQIAMGQLLGYNIESCIEFAADPVDCACSKCGGPQTDLDRLDLARWRARGCPHPLKPSKVEIEGGDWNSSEPKAMTLDGKPYGVLQPVDYEAISRNEDLQPWSRGKAQPTDETLQKRRGTFPSGNAQ
jgi:hypothetical protein